MTILQEQEYENTMLAVILLDEKVRILQHDSLKKNKILRSLILR